MDAGTRGDVWIVRAARPRASELSGVRCRRATWSRAPAASHRFPPARSAARSTKPLRARFNMRGVQSWPLAGELIRGRMFCLDKAKMRLDDLVLGEVVAWLAVTRLESFYWQDRLREAAALDERVRLARDLHDSLLQSQAGAALAARGGPAPARSRSGGRQAAARRRAAAARARRARDALVRHAPAAGARAGGVAGRR